MQMSPITMLILLVCSVGSFALGRWLSRGWRAKRRAKEIAAARAKETRQQRRARERKQG